MPPEGYSALHLCRACVLQLVDSARSIDVLPHSMKAWVEVVLAMGEGGALSKDCFARLCVATECGLKMVIRRYVLVKVKLLQAVSDECEALPGVGLDAPPAPVFCTTVPPAGALTAWHRVLWHSTACYDRSPWGVVPSCCSVCMHGEFSALDYHCHCDVFLGTVASTPAKI